MLFSMLGDKDIERVASECEQCLLARDRPARATPHPWTPATQPWERIHIDYCQFDSRDWLVIVDSFTKWVEVYKMNSTTSEKTIEVLRRLFATFGIPQVIVSDNGTQFTSHEFDHFTTSNRIKHIRSAPYSPKSNGAAEAAVGTFKRAMKKASDVPIDLRVSQFLMYQHTTPAIATQVAPAVSMFGRKTRTRLSFLNPLDQP